MPTAEESVTPEESVPLAMLNGHFAQVRFLLELGKQPNDRLPADGRTSLILCAFLTSPDWANSLARTLIEKGGLVGLRDRAGLNALHWACIYECPHLVEIYLRAIDYDVSQADKLGNTPLHYAARSGNQEVLNMLLAVFTKYNLSLDKANREGVTPLMLAWRADQLAIAELLLQSGADPTRTDLQGRTAAQAEAEARKRHKLALEAREAKRASAHLRYDDIEGWTRQRARIHSAKESPGSSRELPWSEIHKQRMRPPLPSRLEGHLIPLASRFDARNCPETVFRANPVQFFEQLSSSNQQRRSESRPPSAPASTSHQQQQQQSLANPVSWRVQMGQLFQQYQFQWSTSYRGTVRLPLSDGSANSPSASYDKLVHSPDSSEYGLLGRGSGCRRGSVVSVRGGRGRRDRKVSHSPQRLQSTDTSGGDDSVYSPAPSRMGKRRGEGTGGSKLAGRQGGRGGGTNSVNSRDSLGST